jgi:hypothetical protein
MSLFNAMLAMCVTALANITFAQGPARQVSRSGSFDLPCSADTAFPLFSPEGERKWVKGWDPQPVFPETIIFGRDTVFREGQAGEEAVWTILDADWRTHRAEYVRLAPGSHAAHIIVKIEPFGAERSHVVVSYTITAFGEHAAVVLEAFSETAYTARMGNWQQQISAYLEKR